MAKDWPHKLSDDGREYACANCGQVLPGGVQVLAHFAPSGKVTGVRAEDGDGNVRHECGTPVGKGEGPHG